MPGKVTAQISVGELESELNFGHKTLAPSLSHFTSYHHHNSFPTQSLLCKFICTLTVLPSPRLPQPWRWLPRQLVTFSIFVIDVISHHVSRLTATPPAAPDVKTEDVKAEEQPGPSIQPPPVPAIQPGNHIRLNGPFVTDVAYGVVPNAHIVPINNADGSWYAVTQGKWVGVFSSGKR